MSCVILYLLLLECRGGTCRRGLSAASTVTRCPGGIFICGFVQFRNTNGAWNGWKPHGLLLLNMISFLNFGIQSSPSVRTLHVCNAGYCSGAGVPRQLQSASEIATTQLKPAICELWACVFEETLASYPVSDHCGHRCSADSLSLSLSLSLSFEMYNKLFPFKSDPALA